MRLTDASVAIRPRSAWEAIDLGVLLARRHLGLLMASWALLTLPLFVLLSALLWQYPTVAVLLFWWIKPAWERLPLHIRDRLRPVELRRDRRLQEGKRRRREPHPQRRRHRLRIEPRPPACFLACHFRGSYCFRLCYLERVT